MPNSSIWPIARVDLWVMAMKGYSAFPIASALLEPHYHIVSCHIQNTRWCVYEGGGLTPLQRCSRGILLPQLTGLLHSLKHSKWFSRFIWLKGITTPILSGLRNNGNGRALHPHSNLQGRRFVIWWFSVISRTFVVESLTHLKNIQSTYSKAPGDKAGFFFVCVSLCAFIHIHIIYDRNENCFVWSNHSINEPRFFCWYFYIFVNVSCCFLSTDTVIH